MKNLAYKILDYFHDHDRARMVWMYVAWTGLMLSVLTLPWWQYTLVIFFALLIHWHGLVDGAKNAVTALEEASK